VPKLKHVSRSLSEALQQKKKLIRWHVNFAQLPGVLQYNEIVIPAYIP
jgi:hypothetical protein